MTHPPIQAELLLDSELAESAEVEWCDLLDRIGVAAEGERTLPHRAAGPLDWLVLLVLPLHAFLSTLGAAAMTDLYETAKRLARQAKPKQVQRKPLVLEDAETGLRIVVDADLPPEALDQLLALRLGDFRKGPLHYDRSRRSWRSIADEADE